jgi:hypothetical protein
VEIKIGVPSRHWVRLSIEALLEDTEMANADRDASQV